MGLSEEARRAEKALRKPKPKPPALSPIDSLIPNPSSSPTAPRLVLCSTMPKVYADLQKTALHPSISRNDHESRYRSGSVPGWTRDQPTLAQISTWKLADNDPYHCLDVNSKTHRGNTQVSIIYFETPTTPDGENIANLSQLVFTPNREMFVKGDPDLQLPTGIRPRDCYLGGSLSDIEGDTDLSLVFPTDINPSNNYPYTIRVPCGSAFRPRLRFRDFPKNRTWTEDRRIGYSTQGSGEVVIYGGRGFDLTKLSKDEWVNFHHHFVKITGRPRSELLAVLQKPEEIQRQKR
ncbi:hypothetical protein VTL71DRAFT_9773 [Oculimacula yallundae]|uniref:Uncharacterized protein n=1 Tax=Oculimacula yallundae TaxID=86028 RepID=A0ABR4BRX4_9HELO